MGYPPQMGYLPQSGYPQQQMYPPGSKMGAFQGVMGLVNAAPGLLRSGSQIMSALPKGKK